MINKWKEGLRINPKRLWLRPHVWSRHYAITRQLLLRLICFILHLRYTKLYYKHDIGWMNLWKQLIIIMESIFDMQELFNNTSKLIYIETFKKIQNLLPRCKFCDSKLLRFNHNNKISVILQIVVLNLCQISP